jgi:hypothetical protein
MALRILWSGLFMLLATLGSGCGSTHRELHDSAKTTRASAEIRFWSPALAGQRAIPADYICRRGAWLPFRWEDVPRDAKELVLVSESYTPNREGSRVVSSLAAASGVIGLRSSLDELTVGAIPRGSSLVTYSGFPACPPESADYGFIFKLFAVPSSGQVAAALHERSPLAMLKAIQQSAVASGEFGVRYR